MRVTGVMVMVMVASVGIRAGMHSAGIGTHAMCADHANMVVGRVLWLLLLCVLLPCLRLIV